MKSLHRAQGSEFRQAEIDGVVPPVGACPIRVALRNVGDLIEMDVVQHHEVFVPADHQILFKIVCSLTVCEGLGFQRMFRQIGRCTAVGDHHGTVRDGLRIVVGQHCDSNQYQQGEAEP